MQGIGAASRAAQQQVVVGEARRKHPHVRSARAPGADLAATAHGPRLSLLVHSQHTHGQPLPCRVCGLGGQHLRGGALRGRGEVRLRLRDSLRAPRG